MKVEPDVFDVFPGLHLKELDQALCQLLLSFLMLLNQVDHNHPSVMGQHVIQVTVEDVGRQLFVTLD